MPEGGGYTLKVHIDPLMFMRHDEVNGKRYLEPVDVVFEDVEMKLGKEPVDPPKCFRVAIRVPCRCWGSTRSGD